MPLSGRHLLDELSGEGQRQGGFAGAARADQRGQAAAVLSEQTAKIIELALAADDHSAHRRQRPRISKHQSWLHKLPRRHPNVYLVDKG
jgi:hypothetical protein